ncbi:hypothetical protein PENSPDRAFT_650516 [Peniophora sp. CONT]|nr:hypothetical protein PENSPDRAFT_650516 [Peniophora sp. CONT]
MCQNIISGRFYSGCGHFAPMSTRFQDCMRPNCLFSSRHEHPVGERCPATPEAPVTDVCTGCRSPHCIRMMAQPIRNPIRVSPACCSNCIAGDR